MRPMVQSNTTETSGSTNDTSSARARLVTTAIAAMGVVFGDIGTSPLYAMKEAFNGHHALSVTPNNIFGILSLIFWAMTITVTIRSSANVTLSPAHNQ